MGAGPNDGLCVIDVKETSVLISFVVAVVDV